MLRIKFTCGLALKDMWIVFNKFGKIGDVYITKKVSKHGVKLGFLRFSMIINIQLLIKG